MKKNVTYIDASKFEAIIRELGINAIPQAGFVKCSNAYGRTLYVANTKRVGRVDLSGFEVDPSMGVTNLGGESFGAVKQQLDFSLPEDQVLANFKAIATHMLTLAPVEKAAKAKPAGEAKPKAQGWSTEVTEMSAEEKEKRAALIARVAKEKGVQVSKKAKHAKKADEATEQTAS